LGTTPECSGQRKTWPNSSENEEQRQIHQQQLRSLFLPIQLDHARSQSNHPQKHVENTAGKGQPRPHRSTRRAPGKKITINLKTTVLLTPEEIDSATKLTLTYSPLGKQGHVKIWGLQS
jgi:hypothetical protein